MKWLFMTTASSPFGGSEFLWQGAARRLAGSGETVMANMMDWQGNTPRGAEALQEAGVQIHIKPNTTSPSRVEWILQKLRRRLGQDPEYDFINTYQPDAAVLSLGGHDGGITHLQALIKRQIPFTVIVQATRECMNRSDGFIDTYRGLLEQAERILVVGKRNIEQIEWHYGQRFPQAEVVWNPYNVPFNDPPAWPESDEYYNLAVIGRFEQTCKGQDIIFRVMRKNKWRERNIRITLFGAGPQEHLFRRLVKMHDLKMIHFGGFVPNIQDVWKTHHALLLPSRYEGLPLALVEAGLSNRPAIVTDVSGNAELIIDNETGFIADAPCESALDRTLEEAWQRRAEWIDIGKAFGNVVRTTVPEDPIESLAAQLKRIHKISA